MISSNLINFLLIWLIGEKWKSLRKHQFWKYFIPTVLLGWFGWAVLSVLAYAFIPAFYDQAEASMAGIAAQWLGGGPIYHSTSASERFSLIYGPVSILAIAFFESLGSATNQLAKLPGVINMLASLVLVHQVLKHHLKGWWIRLLWTAAFATTLLSFSNSSYWNRPDSFLLFFVTLSLWVVEFVSWSTAVLAICGFLAGLSINCKIYSGIIFIPAFFYFIEVRGSRFRWWHLLVGVTTLAIGLVAPFLLPRVSAMTFFSWIAMLAGEKLVWAQAIKNISFMVPFFILLFYWKMPSKWPLTFYSLLGTTIVIGVLSGKPGSGLQFFIPMMPLFFIFGGRLKASSLDVTPWRLSVLLSAFVITVGYNAYERQKSEIAFFTHVNQHHMEFQDLKSLVSGIRGRVEMGYTNDSYELTFYRPWLVHRSQGLFIDAAALMEMNLAGRPLPLATYKMLASCQISYFVLPKEGLPWGMRNINPGHKSLFDSQWRQIFANNYHLVRSSKYYRLYQCRAMDALVPKGFRNIHGRDPLFLVAMKYLKRSGSDIK